MTLKKLKAGKSTGLDKLPAKFLKLSADVIAPSLTNILNLSHKCDVYVDEWKKARVTPIYKSDDKTKCENYRPISILPIINKVFETEVFSQVNSHLFNRAFSPFKTPIRFSSKTFNAIHTYSNLR